jgi:hypothetical protein
VNAESTADPATGPAADPDDDAPLDPAEMLALAASAKRGVRRVAEAQVPVHYFVWGGAWLVGYTFLWAAWEGTTSPIVVPMWLAAPLFGLLLVGAAVVSGVVGARSTRGISGGSSVVGIVYGLSWMILGLPAGALGAALTKMTGVPDVGAIFYPSVFALIAAAMYLAGFMLWRSVDQLVIAIVLAVAAGVTPWYGAPVNLLAMAIIAGGALLAGGVVAVIRNRRRG